MVITTRSSSRQSMPAAASAFASAFLGRMESTAQALSTPPPSSKPRDRDAPSSTTSNARLRSHTRSSSRGSVDVDLTTRDRPTHAAHYAPGDRRPELPVANIAVLCAAATGGFLMLSLVLHCGIVASGLVVPAWGTFKALERRPGAAPLERFGAFWVLVAMVFAMDRLVLNRFLRPWLPGPAYDALLFVMLMWLGRNDGEKAERVYDGYVAPTLLKYEQGVDGAMAGIAERIDDVASYGLIKMSDSVRPIAMQLEHAASAAARDADRRRDHRRVAHH